MLRVGGSIDDFVYTDLVLEGRRGEVCPGQIRSGTLRAFYEIVDRFGGQAGTMYYCRERWDAINDPDCNGTLVNPRSNPNFQSTCWSNHATGRAFDVMVGGSASSGYNRQRGLSIVNWLLATDAQNSTNANARDGSASSRSCSTIGAGTARATAASRSGTTCGSAASATTTMSMST